MHWIESAGGPLIILAEETLDDWGGASWRPQIGSAEEPFTDYDRACAVEGYIGFLPVGREKGIVLGEEPMQTTWLPDQASGSGILARWVFGESETAFLDRVSRIPPAIFHLDGAVLIEATRLFLFDSALAGRDLKKKPEEYLVIEIRPGVYDIKTAVYQPDDHTSMVVHHFEARSCTSVVVQQL